MDAKQAFKAIEAAGLFPAELSTRELIDFLTQILGAYLRTSAPESAVGICEATAAQTQLYVKYMQENDNVPGM